MGVNWKIARIFYQIADILELKNDRWRPQAYRIAAQTLESLKEPVNEIYVRKGERGLMELPGIGEALARKIIQYIETKKIDKLENLKKTIPQGLYEMMLIPGIGVKKAKLFYSRGIKTIKQLKNAAEKHELLQIAGFKKRAEEKILEGIKSKGIESRISLKQAEKIANRMLKEIKKIKDVKKIEIAGSVRRKKSSIRDFDFVVLTDNSEKVASRIVKMSFVREVIGKGKEKLTIITKEGRQADFRFFNEDEYGAGLLYFTGDKGHNIWLRTIAIKLGYKLNEYGLFKNNKRIAGKNEQEIYKALGVKMPKPEKRIGEQLRETK